MKKKGFTLVELLVVIAIIAMLMAILMPALAGVKRLAARLICGTNIKGLGTGMLLYSNNYDGDWAVAGGGFNVTWDRTTDNWNNSEPFSDGDSIAIGASFYKLVTDADVGYGSFVCSSSGEKEFDLSDPVIGMPDEHPTDIKDFGAEPASYVSYSLSIPYQDPASARNATVSDTDPARRVVIGDKNPWCDPELTSGTATADNFMPIVGLFNPGDFENPERHITMAANSGSHEREGQNLLYIDYHLKFEKKPDVGVKDDNVYTQMKGTGTTQDDRRTGNSHDGAIGTGRCNTSQDSHLKSDSQWSDV